MNEPKTIAITGAGGFIGRHVLDAFRGDNVQLRLLSRKSELPFALPPGASLFTGDLTDGESVRPFVEGSDVVIHLAAELRDEYEMRLVNTEATERLGGMALRYNVGKFVHLSSVGVTGAGFSAEPLTVTEETACHPRNVYETTKLVGENALREKLQHHPGKLTILRPTNVYGDHHPRKALLRMLQRLNAGKRVGYKEGAISSYVYSGDLAAAIRHAVLNDMAFPVYQVGHSQPFGEFLQQAIAALGGKGKEGTLPAVTFGLARTLNYGGSTRISAALQSLSNKVAYDDSRLLLEFSYPFGNAAGLAKTVQWYRETGNL